MTDAASQTGPKTSFTYNLQYHRGDSTVTDPIGTSTTGDPNDRVTTYELDQHGRITKTTDALGRSSNVEYTSQSQVNKYFAPYNSSTTASVELNYDAGSGNLLSTATQTGPGKPPLQTSHGYNEAGRVPGGTSGAQYLQTSTVNEQGNRTWSTYDGAGNLTKLQAVKADDTRFTDVRMEYDPAAPGKLTKSYDGKSNATSYGYDAKGNLTSVTPPAPLGATLYSYGGANGADQALSRVTTVTDPDGRQATYTYDGLDRVKTITWSNGSSVTNTYDLDGNLTKRVDSVHGTTDYTYDALNRIDYESYPGGQFNDYGYDLASNLDTLQDPGGTTSYEYDAVNRQREIHEPGQIAPVSYARTEDASKDELTITLPNGVTIEQQFDKAGRMLATCSRQTAMASACTNATADRLLAFTYSYAQGSAQRALLQSETDKDGVTTSYAYDAADRLRTATRSDGKTYEYVLDDAGNITTRKETARADVTYAYNAANQLTQVGTVTLSYDLNGNETGSSGGTRTASSYNARNQLTSTTVGGNALARAYAGPGQAERTAAEGKGFAYNALGLSTVSDGGTYRYTRDEAGQLLSQRVPGGSRQYFHADHLGSVRMITGPIGTVVRRQDFDPYGRTTSTSGSAVAHPGFVGSVRDDAGLYHFGQRYYDPLLGRWTQRDPLNQPSDLRQANRYLYAGADPVNIVDPSGMQYDLGMAPCQFTGDGADECMDGQREQTKDIAERTIKCAVARRGLIEKVGGVYPRTIGTIGCTAGVAGLDEGI